MARPQATQHTKRPCQAVWGELSKYKATWSSEDVVALKEFLMKMGPRCKGALTNVGLVCDDNKKSCVLAWRNNLHFGQATTAAEGRVSAQGGGPKPYIVSKSALKAYYDTL